MCYQLVILLVHTIFYLILQTLEKIRKDVGNNYVWVSIDETTDVKGRYIANFIVCKFSHNEPGILNLLP